MDITPIAITNFRNEQHHFGIKDVDRLRHIYVIGKTGTGKSTLLLNMAISDMQRGNGICVIDPHGDIAEALLDYIAKERTKDVIYFDPSDKMHVIAFNPLLEASQGQAHLVVSGLITTFKNIWIDSWGPRLEYILRNTLLTLITYPQATLLDIQDLLTNYNFRQKVLTYCSDQYLQSFWINEFDKYSPLLKVEATNPILNKTGLFNTISQLRNVIGQTSAGLNIQDVMDTGKLLICNLSKGKLGEDASALLGSMIVNAIQLAALNRSSQDEEIRKPFYLYVDEMHSFVSLSFTNILSEARKYKLSLFLTHQYIDQVPEKIRAAIFGNVGTIISFQIGATDAAYIVKEFHPPFEEADLITLPKYSMYIKLMIDGATSKPFSAQTIPVQQEKYNLKESIIEQSNSLYGRLQKHVEEEISNRYKFTGYNLPNKTLFD